MTDLERLVSDLIERNNELAFRLEDAERRIRNMVRFPVLTELDAAKGMAKSIDKGGGEGKDLPLPYLPWLEFAAPDANGNRTTWRPPQIGQRMMLLSPSGNLAEGLLIPAGFSNAAGQPSQSGDEHVETIGKTRTTMTGDTITHKTEHIKHEAKSVEHTADTYVIKAPRVSINPAGGATS